MSYIPSRRIKLKTAFFCSPLSTATRCNVCRMSLDAVSWLACKYDTDACFNESRQSRNIAMSLICIRITLFCCVGIRQYVVDGRNVLPGTVGQLVAKFSCAFVLCLMTICVKFFVHACFHPQQRVQTLRSEERRVGRE